MSLAIEQEIRELAARHLSTLQGKIGTRIEEMKAILEVLAEENS